MTRAPAAAVLVALLGAAPPAWADDGMLKAPITLDGSGPYFRLTIPIDVHLAAAHADLRDVAVEDSTGAGVSYALVPRQARAVQVTTSVVPKWVPLYATPAAPDKLTGFRVERRPDGTVTAVVDEARAAGGARRLRGYMLEAPAESGGNTRLELDWERPAGGIEQISVDASDDLQTWRAWRHGASIAQLEYAGQRIDKRSVELPGERARYVRITWVAPEEAPKLLGVRLDSSSNVTVAPAVGWSKPFAPTPGATGALDYDLGCEVAADEVRVDLSEDNTLAPVELWARASADPSWREVASAVVYRLRIDGRTSEERELRMSGPPVRRLELRTGKGGHLGSVPPSIEVGVMPLELVLLARGQPPFFLTVGDAARQHDALDVATLVPGFGGTGQPEISPARLDMSRAALVPKPPVVVAPPKVDARPYALWAVLIAGVLALAGLAWRVLRETSADDAPRD